jgi:hypothetical protein
MMSKNKKDKKMFKSLFKIKITKYNKNKDSKIQ